MFVLCLLNIYSILLLSMFCVYSVWCCFVPTIIIWCYFVRALYGAVLYLLNKVLFYTYSIWCCFIPTQYGTVLYQLNKVLFCTY